MARGSVYEADHIPAGGRGVFAGGLGGAAEGDEGGEFPGRGNIRGPGPR